jgi:pimeloyl-ACP methyl ester carboxylesterase
VSIAPGVELAYIDQGVGQPIVFIPHWTFTKEVFEHQIDVFSTNYRVIAYDPRSQGESSFVIEGNDYVTHAYDLTALLEALNVHNPILVGWGTGAFAAWGFIALNGSASVAANVVIDMPPNPLSTTPGAWREGSFENLAAIHTLFLRDARGQANFMRRCLETDMVQRGLTAEELSRFLELSLRTNPLVAAQLFASAVFADQTNSAIAAARERPSLFVIAQNASSAAISYLGHVLPESKYVVFGGRMMFWEHYGAFNHVLLEFIHSNVAAAQPLTGKLSPAELAHSKS